MNTDSSQFERFHSKQAHLMRAAQNMAQSKSREVDNLLEMVIGSYEASVVAHEAIAALHGDALKMRKAMEDWLEGLDGVTFKQAVPLCQMIDAIVSGVEDVRDLVGEPDDMAEGVKDGVNDLVTSSAEVVDYGQGMIDAFIAKGT